MSTKLDYAPAELMACVLARDLRDGDFGAMGAASQIPMAAVKLARRLYAKNLTTLTGGSGAINSRYPHLLASAADYRNLFGAECKLSMEDTVDIEVRGFGSFVCYGAMQVDRFGNLNMLAIGDYAHPKVRGPGSLGLSLAAAFRRFYIYLAHHERRNLVELVDHVSGPGFMDGSAERDRFAMPYAKGPVLCVTPLCVFDFPPEQRQMRLKSVHPGVSVETVLARTGFAPLMPQDDVPETTPPSAEELRLLREEIDTQGVLQTLTD
jgi:glutaconate CoA-transferase, subunit B